MKKLGDYYAEHAGKGSDKWDLYLNSYSEILAELKEKPISLLEIGVQNGGALEIWSKYFSNARKFVGCDIDQRCASLKYEDKRVSLIIGDINEEDTLRDVLSISSGFDLIIDDGSHTSADIIKSFVKLFPRVNDDGIYIIEDLHCSYWAHYGGGLFYPDSSMNFLKALADVINHQHWGNGYSRAKILEGFCAEDGGILSDEELSKVHSIQFINSICVIKKKVAEDNVLKTRVFSGTEFKVCETARINSHGRIVEASEFANKWAYIQKTAEEHEAEKTQLSEEKDQLSALVETLKSSNRALEEEIRSLAAAVNEKSIYLERITASLSWRITGPLRSLRILWRKIVGL